jgi:hypothetical protein
VVRVLAELELVELARAELELVVLEQAEPVQVLVEQVLAELELAV